MSETRIEERVGQLVRVTPPALQPVSLDEAKAHLNVMHDDDDALIAAYIAAATGDIDGDTHLGRALVEQEWEWRTSCFGSEIKIPLPPLIEVVAITYLDEDETEQTVDEDVYRVIEGGEAPSRIVLKRDQSWPSTCAAADAVRVRFTCGYARPNEESPPGLDYENDFAPLRAVVLLMVGHLYQFREPVVTGTIVAALPFSIQSILEKKKIAW